MYLLGPWPLKILMFALLVTREKQHTVDHGNRPETANIPNVVECLTLTFVDCDCKCHSNWKLTTTQNKWPISPIGGHDDARYEHTFVDIVSCDDFRFNDTLT